MNQNEKLRALLAEARIITQDSLDSNTTGFDEEFKVCHCDACERYRSIIQRIDAALAEPVEELLTYDEHKNMTQRHVDYLIHYRNLAIVLGAKPEHMLCEYDRKLCEAGIDPDENMGGMGPNVSEVLKETEDLWDMNDRLKIELERTGVELWGAQEALRDIDPVMEQEFGYINRAYQRGAEAMREVAAQLFDGTPEHAGLARMPLWAAEIRALPIPEDK